MKHHNLTPYTRHTHMFNLNFIMANTITDRNKRAYTTTNVQFQCIMANTMTDSYNMNQQAYILKMFCVQVSIYSGQLL